MLHLRQIVLPQIKCIHYPLQSCKSVNPKNPGLNITSNENNPNTIQEIPLEDSPEIQSQDFLRYKVDRSLQNCYNQGLIL
jgi:hypothetical protein